MLDNRALQKLETNSRKFANVLSIKELKDKAPSIFAKEPSRVSSNYRFVPTSDVVASMIQEGFMPVHAGQRRAKLEYRNHTRHLIRFRHIKVLEQNFVDVDKELPEIVMLNSHDGSSSYQLMAGFFRMVCENGLITASSMLEAVIIRHKGDANLPQIVTQESHNLIENVPLAMQQIEAWRGIQLDKAQQLQFAKAAAQLRAGAILIDPESLLGARREADEMNNGKRDLWRTMNVVQENIIRGGIVGHDRKERIRTVRSIKSITQDVHINRKLWVLTEEMEKLVA